MEENTLPATGYSIDPEFQRLIPPLSEEEYAQLEANVLAEGIRDPLVIWREENLLVDGHNRHRIAEAHELILTNLAYLSFESREAAIDWIIANQVGRRNLPRLASAYFRGRRYNDRVGNGRKAGQDHAKDLADEHGVSSRTIKRDAELAAAIDRYGVEHRDEILAGKWNRGPIIEYAGDYMSLVDRGDSYKANQAAQQRQQPKKRTEPITPRLDLRAGKAEPTGPVEQRDLSNHVNVSVAIMHWLDEWNEQNTGGTGTPRSRLGTLEQIKRQDTAGQAIEPYLKTWLLMRGSFLQTDYDQGLDLAIEMAQEDVAASQEENQKRIDSSRTVYDIPQAQVDALDEEEEDLEVWDRNNPSAGYDPGEPLPHRGEIQTAYERGITPAVAAAQAGPGDEEGAEEAQEAKKPHVAQSSGYYEWFSPEYLVVPMHEVFDGPPDVDPFSNEAANEIIKAKTYYTKETNGLAHDWPGYVWYQPPYADELQSQASRKAAEQIDAGITKGMIALVNNATETGWFRRLACRASVICFLCKPTSRVKYWRQDGTSHTPLQAQAMIYVGDAPEWFKRAYAPYGYMMDVDPEYIVDPDADDEE